MCSAVSGRRGEPDVTSRLAVERVHLSYGRVHALDDVSFTMAEGVTALLGINGAGKSSLIRVLVGALSPDSGRVVVLDGDGSRVTLDDRRRGRLVGYLPQDVRAVPGITCVDYLEYVGFLKGLPGRESRSQAPHLLDDVGLGDHARARTRALSGGMLRRLGFAAALVGDPDILIVDEPTAGLDFQQRSAMRELIRSTSARSSVLLSTHLADDVAALAHDVVVLDAGRVKYSGSLDELATGGCSGADVERAFLALVEPERTGLTGGTAPVRASSGDR